jgi:hypothetical protein
MSEKRVTVRQRRAIATRAKNCCEYYLSPANFTTDPFAVEHIAPVYHGGKTTFLIFGLTPTGRATIDALQLNRPEVVNLRRVLRLSREYPPTQLEDAETPERG